MKAVFLAITFILSGVKAFAMVHIGPPPDEMAATSTLICNGVVESITDTKASKNVENSEMGTFTAKIKVLHVFKGKAEAELELRYENFEWEVPNGAVQVRLKKGGRYRFFLKNGATPTYFVSSLQGKQMDDGYAIEPLLASEPDDSAYVSKAEALQLARKWMVKNYPDAPWAADHETWQKLHDESRQPFWVVNVVDNYIGSWDVSLVKVSLQGSELESKTLNISHDRTVTIKNR